MAINALRHRALEHLYYLEFRYRTRKRKVALDKVFVIIRKMIFDVQFDEGVNIVCDTDARYFLSFAPFQKFGPVKSRTRSDNVIVKMYYKHTGHQCDPCDSDAS